MARTADEVQRLMSMKPAEIVGFHEHPDGTMVETWGGIWTLIRPDGSTVAAPTQRREKLNLGGRGGVDRHPDEPVYDVEKRAPIKVEATVGKSDVPDGTAKEILEWVGEDVDRAQRALDAELKRDPQRTTLVASLSSLLAKLGFRG